MQIASEFAVPELQPVMLDPLNLPTDTNQPPMRCGWGACKCGRCGAFGSGHIDHNRCSNCGCPYSDHES
jgi:hypothetical protein